MTGRGLWAALAVLALGALPAGAQQRPPAGRAPRAQARDTARDTTRIEYYREVFNYSGGTRDPFQTLITSGDVRPTIEDLRLVGILYDPRGRSIATVQEQITGGTKSHRLRRGDQVGRLRVIQILPTQVVFQVEEFGFERQQTLTLQRRERTP